MPHSGASDLGLHCSPITLLGVSRQQWVNNLTICHIFSTIRNNLFMYKKYWPTGKNCTSVSLGAVKSGSALVPQVCLQIFIVNKV